MQQALHQLDSSFAYGSVTSALQDNHDSYSPGDRLLPMHVKLTAGSPLKTVHGRPGVSERYANELGNSLRASASELPLHASQSLKAPAIDAEYQAALKTTRAEASAEALAATAAAEELKASLPKLNISVHDQVSRLLTMRADPLVLTPPSESHRVFSAGPEYEQHVKGFDKTHQGIFALTEERRFTEVALKYRALPLQSARPPWPKKE